MAFKGKKSPKIGDFFVFWQKNRTDGGLAGLKRFKTAGSGAKKRTGVERPVRGRGIRRRAQILKSSP
jgi:hypothetical protein